MRRAVAVLSGSVLALGLTGCGGAPAPEELLAQRVDAVTRAANDRDAEALREATLQFADTVSAQRDAQQLPATRAQELLSLATTLRERADVVDPEVQARIEAEADAARAREQAAAERAAREQVEREAAQREASQREAAAQAERERAAERDKGRGDDKKDDKKAEKDDD